MSSEDLRSLPTIDPLVELLESRRSACAGMLDYLISNCPHSNTNEVSISTQTISYLENCRYDNDIIEGTIELCSAFTQLAPDATFLQLFQYLPSFTMNTSAPLYSDDSKFYIFSTKMLYQVSPPESYARACILHFSLSIIVRFLNVFFDQYKQPVSIYSLLIPILYDLEDDDNLSQIKLISVNKLASVLNYISKHQQKLVISDIINRLANFPINKKSNYQLYMLKLCSGLVFTSDSITQIFQSYITNQQSSYFQPIFNIINSSKSSNALIEACFSFLKNFIGQAYIEEQLENAEPMMHEIKHLCKKTKIYSPIALIYTLSPKPKNKSQIQKYIPKTLPTWGMKINDTLQAFTIVMKGKNFCPQVESERNDINLKWRPLEKDESLKDQFMKIILNPENCRKFETSQQCCLNLLLQVAVSDFNYFYQNYLINLISEEFFSMNCDIVLMFVTKILSPESHFVEYAQLQYQDALMIQFKDQMQRICIDMLHREKFNTQSKVYITNSLCASLDSSSCISNLVEQTIVYQLPQMPNLELKLSSVVSEQKLKTVKYFDYTSSNLIRLMYLSIHTVPSAQLIQVVSSYIFHSSPYISALAIRIMQAFIHMYPSHSLNVLSSVLSLKIETFEQFYLFGYSLVLICESLVHQKISISTDIVTQIYSWNIVFLCLPFPHIRQIAFELSEIIEPILPPDQPSLHFFFQNKNEEIMTKSYNRLREITPELNLAFYTLQEIITTRSIIVYHVYITSFFYFFFHSEFKSHIPLVQSLSLILVSTEAGKSDPEFLLNIMSLFLSISVNPTDENKRYLEKQIQSTINDAFKILQQFNDVHLYLSFFSSINPTLLRFLDRLFVPNLDKEENQIFIHSICYFMRQRVENEYAMRDEEELDLLASTYGKIITIFFDQNIIPKESVFKQNSVVLSQYIYQSMMDVLIGLLNIFNFIWKQNAVMPNGPFLRQQHYPFGKSHQFSDNKWFVFLFNMISLDATVYPELCNLSYSCLSVYCLISPFPRSEFNLFTDNIVAIMCLDADIFRSVLSTSFPDLIEVYIHQSIEFPAFFGAIAYQFIQPTNYARDIALLEERTRNEMTKQESEFVISMENHCGDMIALILYYLCSNSLTMKRVSYILLYHIALHYNITQLFSLFSQIILCSQFQIDAEIIIEISRTCSAFFVDQSSQFLKRTFEIIQSVKETGTFLQCAAPWLQLSQSIQTIIPTFVTLLCKPPLTHNTLLLANCIIETHRDFIIQTLLSQKQKTGYLEAILVYACQKCGFSVFIQYMKFSFWFYKNIEVQEAQDYREIMNFILNAIHTMIMDTPEALQPYLHLIILFCSIYPSNMSTQIIQFLMKTKLQPQVHHIIPRKKITSFPLSKLTASDNLFQLNKLRTFRKRLYSMNNSINPLPSSSDNFSMSSVQNDNILNLFAFTEEQQREMESEIMQWSCFCGDFMLASNALGLMRFPKTQYVSRSLHIVCQLLSEYGEPHELAHHYISKLVPYLGTEDLLYLMKIPTSPIFPAALNALLSSFSSKFTDNSLFWYIINANQTSETILPSFQLISKMFLQLHEKEMFFALIPYFACDCDKDELACFADSSPEIADVWKAELIVKLVEEMPGDHLYVINQFFMLIVTLLPDKYFEIICFVSTTILQMPRCPLISSLFIPLVTLCLKISGFHKLKLPFLTAFHKLGDNKQVPTFSRIYNFPKPKKIEPFECVEVYDFISSFPPLVVVDTVFDSCQLQTEVRKIVSRTPVHPFTAWREEINVDGEVEYVNDPHFASIEEIDNLAVT